MPRGKPLERGDSRLARSRLEPGRKRIPQVSEKREAERDERKAVVDRAIKAEGGRCALWWMTDPPCFGDLVGHEAVHRSVRPGSHLEDGIVIAACVGHNGWEDVQTDEVAENAGIRAPSWAIERYGIERVAAELRRIRRERSFGRTAVPFWR
jgi:hypothetical protein